MTRPTLTYFDMSASRGEEVRLALTVAGVDFIDNRIKRDQWLAMKPTSPFGSMPLFEIPGKPILAQTNAILTYIGRNYDLLPSDTYEEARHQAIMVTVEDLRGHVQPQLRISEEPQKSAVRKELATTTFPTWAGFVERWLGDGPFVGGSKISVADFKLYIIYRWVASGGIDMVPADTFAPFTKLTRVYKAVGEHPKVAAWVSSH